MGQGEDQPVGGRQLRVGRSAFRQKLGFVAQLPIAFQCLGPEPGGEGEVLAVVGELGKGQAFGVVCGLRRLGDVGPHLGECLLFLCREVGQRRLVADASQVAVLLPVPQGLHAEQPRRLGLAQVSEFGLQPVEGLTAEFRFRRVVERRLILALPGGGQGRVAGGVVAGLGLAVGPELRVACQRLGPEPGGEGVLLEVGGDLSEGQAFGVFAGFAAFATSAHNWVNGFRSCAGSLANNWPSRIDRLSPWPRLPWASRPGCRTPHTSGGPRRIRFPRRRCGR